MEQPRRKPGKSPAARAPIILTRRPYPSLVDDLCSIAEQIIHVGNEETTPLAQEILRRLAIATYSDDRWQKQVETIHIRHPGFLVALNTRCPHLTRRERQICVLIRLEMDTGAMADFLGTGRKNIDNRRNSIRRKLGIPPAVSLRSVLEAF